MLEKKFEGLRKLLVFILGYFFLCVGRGHSVVILLSGGVIVNIVQHVYLSIQLNLRI